MKVKTNSEISGIRFLATGEKKAAEFAQKEFNGEVKRSEDGRALHRVDELIVISDGQAVKDQVSISIIQPVDLEAFAQYEATGVLEVNTYDKFKTSIVIESLVKVGK